MPRFDNQSDVITHVDAVEKGDVPVMSSTPKYLAIRGRSLVGQREVLISESAARVLLARLKELCQLRIPSESQGKARKPQPKFFTHLSTLVFPQASLASDFACASR